MKKIVNHNAGFSIVELLISISLGLVVLVAITAMFGSTIKGSTQTLRSARLNQDLTTTMSIMSGEIRRAGYSAGTRLYGDNGANSGDVNDGTDDEVDIEITSTDDGGCILYSYDRGDGSGGSPDGTIQNSERNGVKIYEVSAEGKAIWVRNSCSGTSCDTSCDHGVGNWVRLTDPTVIEITSLTFDSICSKCRNIDQDSYWIITDDNNDSTAAPSDFACAETTMASLTFCQDGNDDGTIDCPPGSVPSRGDWIVEGDPDENEGERTIDIRQVNITLSGELVEQPDNVNVTKTMTTTIFVSNNMVRRLDES
jgi:type IV pilus assembly protein PilW